MESGSVEIIGCPPEAWDYEFIAAYCDDAGYHYLTHSANAEIAYGVLKPNDDRYVVFHNVRISGKKN